MVSHLKHLYIKHQKTVLSPTTLEEWLQVPELPTHQLPSLPPVAVGAPETQLLTGCFRLSGPRNQHIGNWSNEAKLGFLNILDIFLLCATWYYISIQWIMKQTSWCQNQNTWSMTCYFRFPTSWWIWPQAMKVMASPRLQLGIPKWKCPSCFDPKSVVISDWRGIYINIEYSYTCRTVITLKLRPTVFPANFKAGLLVGLGLRRLSMTPRLQPASWGEADGSS